MGDRSSKKGAAPFYAAPRRKTSAEIISEARDAIREMSGPSSGTSLSALRPLSTRRPFTPREPQRTLFHERTKKKDPRTTTFEYNSKYTTLAEDNEDLVLARPGQDEDLTFLNISPQLAKNKKALIRSKVGLLEKATDSSSFAKLPHLSGKSKPLHRRNTTSYNDAAHTDNDLAQAISITRPIGQSAGDAPIVGSLAGKSHSPDVNKRGQYGVSKSLSCDDSFGALGDVGVKQIAVQLPKAVENYHSMTLLELSEALSQKSHDTNRTMELLQALQNKIEACSPTGSLRDLVLRSLYTHIDGEDEVLVSIARAMLTMRVTGSHLATASKLVFKIARNDKNDHFFRNSNLLDLVIEGCGRAEPLSESECCVYAAGALRFLALNPVLCDLAHRAGALHLAALHLKILNNAKTERPRQMSEQAIHALYQVTGAMRNLANSREYSPSFVTSAAIAELLSALQLHTDRDVLTNVARCLSVLSAEEACCSWLCACAWSAHALISALAACASRAPLAVRLTYTLGNMAAADEQASINIYNEENSLDVLLTILESYTKRTNGHGRDLNSDPDLNLVGSDLEGSDGSNEDVLVKTVRVIANLCLSEVVGKRIASSHGERSIRALLSCLEVAEQYNQLITEKEQSHYNRHHELAMASLATLNNVTFYLEPPPSPRQIDDTLDLLCKATCRWTRQEGMAACEALRTLGNLSRSARASQILVLEGALDFLPRFSTHHEADVRYAAAGLLVNVCGAGCGIDEGVAVAASALNAAAEIADAPTAALLARALWNAHAHKPLHPEHVKEATDALASFIDDDSIFSACEAHKVSNNMTKQHVKFAIEQESVEDLDQPFPAKLIKPGLQVNDDLPSDDDVDVTGYSGEDLGFEDGEVEECDCDPCRRLAAWEELVGVAIPLLEKLRPARADASVGTD
ncbi:unnamed protein product [Leptosia nina]|uniref:Armadillo repeat-containing protein 2 n=1 Tax=Leptosia nina TaxID=320188 RepID=A0AAV1IWA9_9NEOP